MTGPDRLLLCLRSRARSGELSCPRAATIHRTLPLAEQIDNGSTEMTMLKRTVCAAATLATCASLAGTVLAQQPAAQPAKPDHMQHRFDDPAKLSKSFDDPAREAWQMPAKVIEALGLKPGMSVADIGAGTGYFSMRLAKTSADLTVFAVDIEPAMVTHLKNRAMSEHLKNVVPVLAGAASPNLPKPVDLVLIVDTYHHLPSRVAYFRDLRKSLTPAGRVAIIDFRKESSEGPPVEFRFSPQQIEDEMRQAGFRLDGAHDFLPRQHFLVFR
jgi:ubiquinone/menaquinone biosynthesis C-methylase UbiE